MYYNIASRVVDPALQEGYSDVSDVCKSVQTFLNDEAGIGISAQTAPLNASKAKGIINRLSEAENFDDISWMLDSPIENFCLSTVDDHVAANADFHYKAGLHPKIIRKAEANCCKWCSNLNGTYDYSPGMDRTIFRRHENCRCSVEYDPANGSRYRQDVWSKVWKSKKVETQDFLGEKYRSDYRDYHYSSDFEEIVKNGCPIKMRKVLNTDNEIYVDTNLRLSKKQIHDVDVSITEARKKLGISNNADSLPKHVIYDEKTIASVAGPSASYLYIKNIMYFNADLLSHSAMTQRAVDAGYVQPKKYISTFIHEYSHWNRSQQWKRETKAMIEKPNISEFSKQILDKMNIKEKELKRISEYARDNFSKGVYEECLAEYDTYVALK